MYRSFTFFLIAVFLFFNQNIQAQDTTVVQTFTWDSTARSAYFDFPDDPEKTYEKILMIYNMRCHDAAVGNGSVGCREWDYSCNTFLYVPERQDSSLAFHYDYDISQHNDDYFAYNPEEIHYTYYAFNKITTEYKKINTEYEFEIDSNNDWASLPTGEPVKIYMLYTTGELAAAELTPGDLHGLGINISGTTGFDKARIRLANTSVSELQAEFYPTEILTEVFFDDLAVQNGLNRFNFHTPFEWDGASNILLELSVESITGPDPAIQINTGMTDCLISEKPSKSALEFGGSWGIELDPELFDPVSDKFTVAFWSFGRPQSLPDRNTTVLEGQDADGNRTINIHLPWSNSGIYWDCGNQGGSYDRINKGADPSAFESNWNHWAFTKNTTTGSMKIYLNGRLWHSGEGKTRPIDVHSFRLGSSVGHSLGYYGMLDEVGFLNIELDEADIQSLMMDGDPSDQPWFGNVLAWYDLEEGSGKTIQDLSPNGFDAYFEGGPEWRRLQTRDIHMHHQPMSGRPAIILYRGDYDIEQETAQVIDTTITPKNSIIQYAVQQSQLVALDTFFLWEAVDSKIYNEAGEELESIFVEPIEFLLFEELQYYNFRNAKFELLSLVTPYGNGLNLGPEGKTFTFDVTDFAPILKGNKRLSIEMGGQNQEELDIKFLFIEGIPTRNVLDIHNIWPFDRGYYDPIQDDRVFEPRQVNIPQNITQAKIRSSITGHGQNGEFVARNHRIHLNGNEQVFQFDVWKECAFNPIYPQGGTWLYDRAGWCPGMATDLHEFEITPFISPGGTVEIDYDVFGPSMNEANYLVSNQIVYYDTPNFSLDASLEHIVRPNRKAVEFARFNPNCTDPAVIIKNNGTTPLTSLQITFGVEGVSEKSYEVYFDELDFLETTEINLPIGDISFYGPAERNTFYVRIEKPNGLTDEYSPNNALTSTYVMPDVYEGYERWLLRVRTNNRAAENQYKLTDQLGNVILSRQSLENNTTYDDEITLPPGCYHFEITDSGNDGLAYWHNPSAGNGYVSIRRMANDDVSFERIRFEQDFGGAFEYDYIVDESVGTTENTPFSRVSFYPNPVSTQLNLDLEGLTGKDVTIHVLNNAGQIVQKEKILLNNGSLSKTISTNHLPAGHYLLKLVNESGSWVKAFIVL